MEAGAQLGRWRGLRIVSVEELNFPLWRSVVELYSRDPLTHLYLLYDLTRELDRSRALFLVDGGVRGYMLAWRGQRTLGVHLWGEAGALIPLIPRRGDVIVQVHCPEHLDAVVEELEEWGEVKVRYYLDMVADERSFKPRGEELAVRLDPSNPHHLEQFLELKREAGVSEAGALYAIRAFRYYGVFEDGVLASVACAYLRLPEVWAIGDVYTREEYRGRGYAKAATSAITADALRAGAIALLHVAEDNAPALRVYRALGYREVRRKPWVFFKG